MCVCVCVCVGRGYPWKYIVDFTINRETEDVNTKSSVECENKNFLRIKLLGKWLFFFEKISENTVEATASNGTYKMKDN